MTSAHWWEAVENRSAVTSMYSTPPALNYVRIMHVALDDDGPTLLVKINMPVLPDNPPVRWQRQQYNAAVLELL